MGVVHWVEVCVYSSGQLSRDVYRTREPPPATKRPQLLRAPSPGTEWCGGAARCHLTGDQRSDQTGDPDILFLSSIPMFEWQSELNYLNQTNPMNRTKIKLIETFVQQFGTISVHSNNDWLASTAHHTYPALTPGIYIGAVWSSRVADLHTNTRTSIEQVCFIL